MPVNLDKLTELMAGTTSLPWFVHPFQAWICPAAEPDTPICAMRMATDGACSEQRARDDSELIVAAVNALPDLLALQAEADRMRGALAWFSLDRQLELSWRGPVYGDDDDQSEGWGVHRVSGSINDREWDLVGSGDTPLDAIIAARKALEGGAGS